MRKWAMVKLSEVALHSKGKQINGDELVENGTYNYLNGGISPSGKWSEYNTVANTITISEGGNSCGYVNYMTEPFWCGAHCYFLYDVKGNSRFLYYALKSQQDRIMKLRSGACMPNIKKNDLANFSFMYTNDMNEQEKIVTVLDHVTHLIALHKKQLEKLDLLVKSRFVEMFGSVGTDIKGWGLTSIGKCCEINPKKNNDKRLQSGLEVSFVPMPCVTENGEIDTTDTKQYDGVKTGFTYFAEDDVLFAKITPCMENGKGAVAKGLCNGIGFGSTEFHVLRPIKDICNPDWIYTVTSFKEFRMEAASNMTGSAGQRRVPASFLQSFKISLPPLSLQQSFSAFVEKVDQSKFVVQKSLDKLETLKKSLMQEYFG